MATFKKIKHNVNDFYIKVDKNNGAVIVEPGTGSITLSKDTIISMLDFRRSFAYAEAVKRREITGNSILPVTLEQFTEQTESGEVYLVITQYNLAQKHDMPQITFKRVKVSTGDIEYVLDIPGGVTDYLFREISAAGLKSDVVQLTDVQYVKQLPDETIARSDAVYRIGSDLYKLNEEQDAFTKLTGTFVRTRKLYEFSPTMKENVLYELSTPYKDEFGNEFDRGVYTYSASDNTVEKTDLIIYLSKKLPDVTAAKENYIYLLSKDDIANNKQRGTMWKLNSTKDAYEEETRRYEPVHKLPFAPLAVNGTYYILNDERILQAVNSKYNNLGQIIDVKELPDVSTTILSDTVVYVLTENQGDKQKGSKWIFDSVDKQFVAYTNGYKGHQEKTDH